MQLDVSIVMDVFYCKVVFYDKLGNILRYIFD